MTKKTEELLAYLNDYIKKLPEFNSKEELLSSLKSFLKKVHSVLPNGDFLVTVGKLLNQIEHLPNFDESTKKSIKSFLIALVDKEEKELAEFLGTEEKMQLYSMNKGDKDIRFYFYSHIPEKITSKELGRRIDEVNRTFKTNYPPPNYGPGEIGFEKLTLEHQNVLCIFSQLSVTRQYEGLKTSKDIESFKSAMQTYEKEINELRLKLQAVLTQLDKLTRHGNVPEEDIIKLKKELTILRTEYDYRLVAYEQNVRFIDSYAAHFLRESHWRIISAAEHIKNGKLIWFGLPAQGPWIYVITENEEFIFGNRQHGLEGGFYERLPHATLAQGRRVLASGEAYFVNGEVSKFNGYSGHYFDKDNPAEWMKQVKIVFPEYAKKYGLRGKFEFIEDEMPNN